MVNLHPRVKLNGLLTRCNMMLYNFICLFFTQCAYLMAFPLVRSTNATDSLLCMLYSIQLMVFSHFFGGVTLNKQTVAHSFYAQQSLDSTCQ